MDWGRHEAEDMQSAARRKWRLNPPSEVAHDDSRAEDQQRNVERRAIVSINGQDVNHLDVREREREQPDERAPGRRDRDAA